MDKLNQRITSIWTVTDFTGKRIAYAHSKTAAVKTAERFIAGLNPDTDELPELVLHCNTYGFLQSEPLEL